MCQPISTDLRSIYQSTAIQKVVTYLTTWCKSLLVLSDTEKNFAVEDLKDYQSAQSVRHYIFNGLLLESIKN